jgi:K+-sensing histidine kinase KdpD
MFKSRACVLLEDGGALQGTASDGQALSEADLEAARLAIASGLATRGGAYPVGETSFDFWPLKTPLRRRAVLGVVISGDEAGRPLEPEKLVETVLGYMAVALDREAYAAQALAGEVAVAGEKLKTDLLAAVSHDLKTPLSTILFTLQSLRRFQHEMPARDQLLAGAEAEASRLSGMVDNLLDMNRIEAGALSVRPEICDAADLVQAALLRSGVAAVNGVAPGVVVRVDPLLFESALSNVLANAAKYADGTEIAVNVGVGDGVGWVEVTDCGPGFGGDAEPFFEKFVRGEAGDGRPPGTGLGLALARAFLRAMDGEVTAHDREGGGAVVRLSARLA